MGTDSRPSIALTAANYEAAGKEVIGGAANAGSIADFSGFLTGAEVAVGMTFPQFLQLKYPQVLAVAKQPAYLSGVTVSESEPCSGGGFVTFAGNIQNEDNLSPGDTITMTASNCREGGATVNGSMAIRIGGVSGDMDRYPYSVGLDASTNDFRAATGTTSVQSTGSMTINLRVSSDRSQDLSVTIPSMVTTVSAGGKTETLQYSNYRLTMSVRGSSTSMSINGGVNVPSLGSNLVTVQTLQPLAWSGRYPTAGVIVATTAVGGKMRISAASGTQALIELDANSDGAFESSTSVPWDSIF